MFNVIKIRVLMPQQVYRHCPVNLLGVLYGQSRIQLQSFVCAFYIFDGFLAFSFSLMSHLQQPRVSDLLSQASFSHHCIIFTWRSLSICFIFFFEFSSSQVKTQHVTLKSKCSLIQCIMLQVGKVSILTARLNTATI